MSSGVMEASPLSQGDVFEGREGADISGLTELGHRAKHADGKEGRRRRRWWRGERFRRERKERDRIPFGLARFQLHKHTAASGKFCTLPY